jgi:triosephosphate isomerase
MRSFLDDYPFADDRRVIFFPPALSVTSVAELVAERSDLKVGVQNIYHMDKGAYTGEISAPLARDAGAEYCIVGHSERREIFEETDDQVRLKCIAALRSRLSPLLCVGESRYERMEGRTAEVVGKQLRSVMSGMDASQIAALSIAYEPIWAIGSGETATPQDASDVHRHLRFLLRQAAGPTVADNIHLLYGGSVNPENVAELLAAPEVDGVLVGGASLKVESWLQIVRA